MLGEQLRNFGTAIALLSDFWILEVAMCFLCEAGYGQNLILSLVYVAADEAPAFPFRERPFSPKLKKLKVEQAADIYSDVDPFLVLDGGNGTGFQPDSMVPVHIPEGPDDSPSLANSTAPSSAINFRASQKSGCSYGTSTLTHSVRICLHDAFLSLLLFVLLCRGLGLEL